MSRPLGPTVAVLAARDRAVLWGDLGTLAVLLAQAPLIGALCGLAWAKVESDTASLRFVLCLSAVWLGCINACREIVKERAIIERERLFGVGPAAVVLSKLANRAGLALVQVLALQGVVEAVFAVRGPFLAEVLVLWLAALAGTALGLGVSAVSRRQDRAVAAVPLLVIPQILFSEMVLPRDQFGPWVGWLEDLMPVRWAVLGYEALAAPEIVWADLAWSLVALPALTAAVVGLGVLALRRPVEVLG